MTAPLLFLGIDGVVLVGERPVPYAKPFVHWATQHFQVAWLTRRPPADAFRLARELGLREDAIPFAALRGTPAEAVIQRPGALFVSAPLPPADTAQLAGRLFVTDPRVGVTLALRDQLAQHQRR